MCPIHFRILLVICFSAVFCFACTDDSNNWNGDNTADPIDTSTNQQGTDDTTSVATDVITGSILLPDTFTATPVTIGITFFDSPQLVGIPVGFGDSIANPQIVPGQPFAITSSQSGLQGDYYMAVVVYCEGGGNGLGPVAGVDWWGKIVTAITMGPGTGSVNVGQIEMIVSE